MSTPSTAVRFMEEAITEQLYHNIEMWDYYHNREEVYQVILEEINEVKEAYKDFEMCDRLLIFLKDKNLKQIRDLSFHLMEECIHVIASIDKIYESE